MIPSKLLNVMASRPLKNLTRISSVRFYSAKDVSEATKKRIQRREYRHGYPEFLPTCERIHRNHTRELLERRDMIARRENTMLPEFYVGSVVAVTFSNPPSQGPEKELRFVGIVIERGGAGLRAWIQVRNHIDGHGIEFMFDLYSPTIKDIEVLRLEKRLDDNLTYLRDCDPMYSTFPFDMPAEAIVEGEPVPINEMVIPLGPEPWLRKWQNYDTRLFGYSYNPNQLSYKQKKALEIHKGFLGDGWTAQWAKYDLMREYFLTIPLEEQDTIWEEVGPHLEKRESAIKRLAARKALASPARTETG